MNIRTHARTPSALVATAVALVLVGCAAAPRQDAQLDAARVAVTAAHDDAQVTGDARTELMKADAALSAADELFAAGKPLSDVDHQAYLADRLARTAQQHGKLLASDRQIAEFDNRRNAVLLEAREDDARRANAVAITMTQEAREARADARASAAIAQSSAQEAIDARSDSAVSDAVAASKAQEASDARSDAAASAQDTAAANDRAARLEAQLTDLQGKRTDRGVVVTLGDVQFASGRSELLEGSQRSIGKLASFLADHPQRTVRIEGFTDSIGGNDYNQRLSERRASSVADALTRGGIDPSRIRTEGYGNAYSLAGNDTASGRQQNRRVEVVISDNNQPIGERTR
jgi:outer membrane protein OmpA-like peptidoglycan-associated protein